MLEIFVFKPTLGQKLLWMLFQIFGAVYFRLLLWVPNLDVQAGRAASSLPIIRGPHPLHFTHLLLPKLKPTTLPPYLKTSLCETRGCRNSR